MLTGVRLFEGKTLALIQQHLATPPPPMKERAPRVKVAEDMEALVRRLLAKQPADRFQTPAELLAAIDKIGEVHNLTWPGRTSSPSVPPLSRPGRSSPGAARDGLGRSLGGALSGLTRTWERARDRLFPKRKPETRLGRALQFVRKKLDLPERKPKRDRLWLLIGAAVLGVALLGGVLYYATADRAEDPAPPHPSKAPTKAPEDAAASPPAKENPRSRAPRHQR